MIQFLIVLLVLYLPLCITSSLSLISSLKSEISHLKAQIIKLEKSGGSLSTQLSVQLITGSFISDTTVKSSATFSNSSQTVLSNSHPSKVILLLQTQPISILLMYVLIPVYPLRSSTNPLIFYPKFDILANHLSFQLHIIINIL